MDEQERCVVYEKQSEPSEKTLEPFFNSLLAKKYYFQMIIIIFSSKYNFISENQKQKRLLLLNKLLYKIYYYSMLHLLITVSKMPMVICVQLSNVIEQFQREYNLVPYLLMFMLIKKLLQFVFSVDNTNLQNIM